MLATVDEELDSRVRDKVDKIAGRLTIFCLATMPCYVVLRSHARTNTHKHARAHTHTRTHTQTRACTRARVIVRACVRAELVGYLFNVRWMDLRPAPPDYQRSRDLPNWAIFSRGSRH